MVLPVIVIKGLLTTFTVACADAVQPEAAARTEYTVVTTGEAVTVAALEELRLPAGDHVYVEPPETESVAD